MGIKTLKSHMRKMNINTIQINRLSKPSIIDKVKKWDTDYWKDETNKTLHIYCLLKKELKENCWVDNTLVKNVHFRRQRKTLWS